MYIEEDVNAQVYKNDPALKIIMENMIKSSPKKTPVKKRMGFRLDAATTPVMVSRLWSASPASKQRAATLHNAVRNTTINEMVIYVNKTKHEITVVDHMNLPQLIKPEPHSEDDADAGCFSIRRYIIYRDRESQSKILSYVRSLDKDEISPQDAVVVETVSSAYTAGEKILCFEYYYTSQDLMGQVGFYDPALNVVVLVGCEDAEDSAIHPRFDMKEYTRAILEARGEADVGKSQSVTINYIAPLERKNLYAKLAGQVVEIKPESGQSVLLGADSKSMTTATTYISVKHMSTTGLKTTNYTVENALKSHIVFAHEHEARAHGVYELSESAAWKEAENAHRMELANAAHEAKLKMDLLVIEQKTNADRALNEFKLETAKKIALLESEKEAMRIEHQRESNRWANLIQEAELKTQARENEHKQTIESLKLHQQYASNSASRQSDSSRNTADGIGLAAKVFAGVVTVGAVLWKMFG